MPFDLPEGGGGTITNITNMLTKTPDGLKSLRDGSAITYGGAGNVNTVGGTANAITLMTGAFPFTAYANGHAINILPASTNTGAFTSALDGLAAKAWVKRQGAALVALGAGDVVANVEIKGAFSTQNDAFILSVNPLTALTNIRNDFTKEQAIKILGGQMSLGPNDEIAISQNPLSGADLGVLVKCNTELVGGVWNRLDISKPSAYMTVAPDSGSGHTFQVYHAPAGANPISWTQIFAVLNDATVTTGAFPLNRVGMNGNYTTANLAAGASDDREIAHGLGSGDDVKIMVMAKGNGANSSAWALMVARPDGALLRFEGTPNATGISVIVPSAGNVRFKILNTSGATNQSYSVFYSILRQT